MAGRRARWIGDESSPAIIKQALAATAGAGRTDGAARSTAGHPPPSGPLRTDGGGGNTGNPAGRGGIVAEPGMRYRRSRTDIVPALPSPGSSGVREPLCADDGASVDADARFILSTAIILSLSHHGGYYCMSRRSRRELWITRRVARGQVPLCPCGGRNCGVDLSVENVDRPRPDQQRRSVLPAGVPSTSSTGHPRGACRDKAQRRGSASGHDSRVLDAETERHGALCTPGNPITCAVRTSP